MATSKSVGTVFFCFFNIKNNIYNININNILPTFQLALKQFKTYLHIQQIKKNISIGLEHVSRLLINLSPIVTSLLALF